MYRGTYTITLAPVGCSNITSYPHSGTIHGSITQSGNKWTAALLFSNINFIKNEGGVCTAYLPWRWDTPMNIVSGEVNGNAIKTEDCRRWSRSPRTTWRSP